MYAPTLDSVFPSRLLMLVLLQLINKDFYHATKGNAQAVTARSRFVANTSHQHNLRSS